MGKLLVAVVAISALASMPLLLGCVVEGSVGVGAGMAVSGPPPEPMAEHRPPPPRAHALWIAGYWHWTGMQYAWIPGHWEAEKPGQTWHPPRYSMHEGTYFYEPGTWSGTAPR